MLLQPPITPAINMDHMDAAAKGTMLASNMDLCDAPPD